MANSRPAEIGVVPGSWTVAPLGLFVHRVTYGFTNPMPTTPAGPFMITAKDIHDGRIDYSSARHTSWEAYRQLTEKSRPKVNDVLVTKDGSIGRVAVCDRNDICINQSVAVIQPTERIDSRFLKFLLEAPHYQRRMEGDSDGTTIKHIYITRLDKMEVAAPPIAEQQAIARALGDLDDKIELDRRMIETLEAMTRALFKSWFVDFDPVHAKAEGRWRKGEFLPALPAYLYELLPDSFANSELGEIPKGWRISYLGQVADIIDCLHSKKPERQPQGLPLLQLTNIRQDGLLDLSDTYCISETDYKFWISRMEAKEGDCVITNVGRVGAVAQVPTGVTAALGRNMTGIRCKESFQFPTFLIQALTSDFVREEIEANKDSGTVLEALNVRNIPKLRFSLPADYHILQIFERICRPMRASMESLHFESRTLTQLRDSLLPKLISGKLRVGAPSNNG